MCGRYSLIELPDGIELIPPDEGHPAHRVQYNIAPTHLCPVIPMHDPGHAYLYRWGLVPPWAKDIKMGYKMINARAETLDIKPAFRDPVRKNRCLVLADGFYEWKQTSTGKQPYRITLKSKKVFTFAGLSDTWMSPEGKKVHTFTIITTEPNELMVDIHDRMPVILDPVAGQSWLNPQIEIEEALNLLRPYQANLMKAYPVSPSVGNVKIDSEELIRPFEPPPTLF
ncbi:SOS response-associated peptidase [bacterium]|nr:SOS response-associated peptidase [bacterium]